MSYEDKFVAVLRKIAKGYSTPSQLRKTAEKNYGLSYEEALEMAYENIQEEARVAIRGYRPKRAISKGQ